LSDNNQMNSNIGVSLSENNIIFESSPDAMVMLSEQYYVLEVNPAFGKIFGINKQELLGKRLKDYILPSEAIAESEHIQNVTASGQTIRMNTIRQRADGQPIHVLITAYPLISQAQQKGTCVTYQDITDQVKKEMLLKETEALLRDFAKAVPDKSFIFDEDGRYIEAFGKNLIKPRNEMLKCTLHDLFPPEVAETFLRQIRYTISLGTPQFTIRELKINNEKEVCEERISPMNYMINGKRTVAVILTDINKRTERVLFSNYALQRRSNFFNDIINGNKLVDAKDMEFAKTTLGVDFSMPILCCLLYSEQYTDMSIGDSEYNNRRNLKNSLIEILIRDVDYIVWDCSDGIGVLYQMQSNCEKETDLQFAYRLQEKMTGYNPDIKIVIGVGNGQAGPDNLRGSYRQAWSAILASQCQGESNVQEGIYHYKDIGILQFLARCGRAEATDEFIKETIGKLIEYDEKKETELMTTLEAIVQTNSLREAAEKVCVHPKSVYYRKNRIEKILGVSVDSVDTRFTIAIAIKLYQISKVRLK
jgi:PAS domain S-box-containing protein